MHKTGEEISEGKDLTGITTIVTGANTGIGKETARVLALRNSKVIICCRSLERGEEAKREILQSIGEDYANLVKVASLDLSSLQSIRDCAKGLSTLLLPSEGFQLLINNAGVSYPTRELTQDGFEMHFGVNHLGHFLFTLLLLPHLKPKNGIGRIITLSSEAHRFAPNPDFEDLQLAKEGAFNSQTAYALSKLFNVLFTEELQRRVDQKGLGIVCHSVHPGLIVTDIGRHIGKENLQKALEGISAQFNRPILTIPQGAATTIYAAIGDEAGETRAVYFQNGEANKAGGFAGDSEMALKLWEISQTLTGESF